MEQKALSRWLKIIICGIAVCGLIVYAVIVPAYGRSLVVSYPEFEDRYHPWLFFVWGTGLPCYVVLILGWRISARIGLDRSFTVENARSLKWISWLAAGDAALVFIGNIVLWLANKSHPGVFLISLLIVFAGIAIAVASAALSHLVNKAARLQEQADLTI